MRVSYLMGDYAWDFYLVKLSDKRDFMKKSFVPLIVVILVGCGGDSEESINIDLSSDNNTDGVTEAPPSNFAIPDTLTVVASAKTYNCDSSFPYADATVLMHDINGDLISSNSVDEQGTLTIDRPENAVHISVYGDEGLRQTSIDSFLYFSEEVLPISFISLQQENCSCESVTIDDADLKAQLPTYKFIYNEDFHDDDNTVSICRSTDGAWPSINVFLHDESSVSSSYSAKYDIDPTETSIITLEMADFSEGERLTINSTYAYDAYQSAIVVAGLEIISIRNIDTDGDNIWQFPNNFSEHIAIAGDFEVLSGGEYYQSVSHSKVVDGVANFTDVHAKELFAEKVTDWQNYFMDTQIDYDFSGLGLAKTGISIGQQNTNFVWSVSAPLIGTINQLQLPEALQTKYESQSFEELSVFLIANGSESTYGLVAIDATTMTATEYSEAISKFNYEVVTLGR
ncbi:hypothetical protein [Ferrimonas senticii]|uniref:hypothetical protein n=1 Tax=Ferrimonas senticii TaxID=394566 RepID=UPI0003FAAD1C|nr:hypothetical protein [Ferrimonas senticii]